MQKKKITYKEAVAEIEKILEILENEDPDVDELTENVKRVNFLISYCKDMLTETEKEIQKIMEKEDGE
jgi:exodeoxyribonuclease VII small subunit